MNDSRLQQAEDRATLALFMRRITAREREVLRLRCEADLTQAEIGLGIGVSQMQVSRIIRQSLARLRATTDADDGQTIAASAALTPSVGWRPHHAPRRRHAPRGALSPQGAERAYADLRCFSALPRGGQFAAMEEPELLADDIRAFFKPLRG